MSKQVYVIILSENYFHIFSFVTKANSTKILSLSGKIEFKYSCKFKKASRIKSPSSRFKTGIFGSPGNHFSEKRIDVMEIGIKKLLCRLITPKNFFMM